MEQSLNPTALWIMLLGGGLSIVTLLFLFQKHISGQPLLRYEPRRRVPWGGLAVYIVVFFLGVKLLTSLMFNKDQVDEPLDPIEFVLNGWLNIGLTLVITTIGVGALIVLSHADRLDLGLPDSWGQFFFDVRIGVVACLAALAPVYLIQLVLQFAIQPESHHPLLDQLQNTPTSLVLLTALGAAVLAAPLFEEFVFRLLLQGALERFEDQRLHYSATRRTESPAVGSQISPPAATDFDIAKFDDKVADFDNPFASPVTESSAEGFTDLLERSPLEPTPAHGLLTVLPHGWAPMLFSGILFALAHVGHGADPIPLLLLGIVFGYLYQRTHRIVPCIAAHMCFNTFSLCLAWLQLSGA